MTQSAEFEFVVVDSLGNWYPLDFRLHDDLSAKYLAGVWQRVSDAVEKSHKLRSAPPPDWTHWKPWDWCGMKKAGYQDRTAWMAWCGGQLVGFLNLWGNFSSQNEPGQGIMYIEHLAAFPGDQDTELWRRRYRHVGKALLAYAVKLSIEAGYGGRVGLHSENDASRAFYRKLAADRQLPLFHADKTGIIGPTPHAARGDAARLYLETTSDGATSFLEDYRNE